MPPMAHYLFAIGCVLYGGALAAQVVGFCRCQRVIVACGRRDNAVTSSDRRRSTLAVLERLAEIAESDSDLSVRANAAEAIRQSKLKYALGNWGMAVLGLAGAVRYWFYE